MADDNRSINEFMNVRLVQDHVTAATAYVAQRSGTLFQEGTDGALRSMRLPFDSPLEGLFWVWWSACIWVDRSVDDLFGLAAQETVVLPNGSRYRLDFLIEPRNPAVESMSGWMPIAVELDGHAFHERTPAQVALRDRRDRELQSANWKVFHFSFAEFTAAPVDCLAEVIVFARNQHNRVTMNDYARRRAEATAHNQKVAPAGDSGV